MMKPYPLKRQRPNSAGLTLIELLIVIMIMGIIMTLTIPRLRMINEDRSIREAARIAGSVFAKASQRAITDGVSGVCIELNPNIYDGDNVQYAGTALFMLRALPPYAGTGAVRIPGLDFVIEIPEPHQRNLIQVHDRISLNHSSLQYRILTVGPGRFPDTLRLELDGQGILPPVPNSGSVGYPFVIHRYNLKLQESSRVELPEGYVIDLRFSGPLVSGMLPLPQSGNLPNRTVYHNALNAVPPIRSFATRVLFNDAGSIESFWVPPAPQQTDSPTRLQTQNDLYFLVTRYETKAEREQVRGPNKATADPDPLDNPNSMWLVVNAKTGGTTISYNAPPLPTLPLHERILNARSIALTARSASD